MKSEETQTSRNSWGNTEIKKKNVFCSTHEQGIENACCSRFSDHMAASVTVENYVKVNQAEKPFFYLKTAVHMCFYLIR